MQETRVYLIDTDLIQENYQELTDEQFMGIVEEQGNVYTLPNFQESFNECYVNTATDVIRFITIKK